MLPQKGTITLNLQTLLAVIVKRVEMFILFASKYIYMYVYVYK